MTLIQQGTTRQGSIRRGSIRQRSRAAGRLPAFVGGPRYALAVLVDAVGLGLLRPFLLLYGVGVLGLDPGRAGLALSGGLLAGLALVPLTGRWIDRGARSRVVAATLLARAAGVLVLLAVPGVAGFALAAVLLGVGSQNWPAAHAATVATLAEGRARDAALAAGRSVRNAGLGVGALIATVALAGGATSLRALAAVTAAACTAAAALVWSLRVSGPRVPRARGRDRAAAGPAGGPSTVLSLANLPFAFCFDVLEVALPALLVTRLHVSPAWSSGIFVGNTVLVIAVQVAIVVRLGRRSRRSALTAGGLLLALSYLGFWAAGGLGGSAGAGAVCAVAVLYTGGEILYSGAGTALVVAAAPADGLGRALARWELSNGLGRAPAPAALSALLAVGPGALWGGLAAA
ncbi:MFS transporter, partial [Kitasatospora sp. NPDC058965]|uniref:MFS transporter n=1 Tax=Kitasatospora sp. NPDC058965 TaxID=3346682 RepID=UPI0036ABD6D4